MTEKPKLPQVDEEYCKILSHLLDLHEFREEEFRDNRTEFRTTEDFGWMMKLDVSESFPLIQLKETLYKSVFAELIGFIRGYTNVKDFQALGTNIWDEWANPNSGSLGPIYGAQWRNWLRYESGGMGGGIKTIDQLQNVINTIKSDPNSRRILVSAWNVAELGNMALPPCHFAFQLHCGRDNTLDLMWHQRSVDVFLGLPFNIASYGALLHIIAKLTGRKPRNLIVTMGDFHLYENQIEGTEEVLSRRRSVLRGDERVSPVVNLDVDIDQDTALDDIEPGDLKISGYDPLPRIPVRVAV